MITSATNQHIKDLHKLKQKKHRVEKKLYLVEGYHLVEEAKKANVLKEVLTTEDYDFDNVTLVKEFIIEKLSSTKSPQSIIGVCEMRELDEKRSKYIYLDVSDPINLGTLIRSAVGFGFGIVLSPDSVDEYNSRVLRGSQGAFFNASVQRMTLNETISKYSDYELFAADMTGGEVFESPEKLLLIMGNESSGLPQEVKEKVQLIGITTETIESLNLSVAGSILMHQLKG